LRIHRARINKMTKSPLRRVSAAEQGSQRSPALGSPAFILDDAAYNLGDITPLATGFDFLSDLPIFGEDFFGDLDPFDVGSPVQKPAAKRVALDRSLSTSVLGDKTNSAARKSFTSMPLQAQAAASPSQMFETPSKAFEGLESPSRAFAMSPVKGQPSSRFGRTLESTSDQSWPAVSFNSMFMRMPAPENEEEATEGFDIMQGFKKIGASSRSARTASNGSKPLLGRSNTSNF
jgi:forkhead transcription factor HCM1